MINKKNVSKTSAWLFLAFSFMVFSGCSNDAASNTQSNSVKTINANQAIVVSNDNVNGNTINSNVSAPANMTVNGNTAVKTLTPSTPPSIANVVANAASQKKASPDKEAAPQIGSGGDDLLLVIQIKGALTAADSAFTNSVIVDSKEGNIVLSGNVPNEAARAKALQVAQGIKGVKKVQNSLHVSP